MFEGKPPVPPVSKAVKSGESLPDSPRDDLSAITWSELVAKLGAARDLRAELGQADDTNDASFDAFCAQQLAQQHDRASKESEQLVNPDDLANGKPRGCKEDARSQSDTTANRGNS